MIRLLIIPVFAFIVVAAHADPVKKAITDPVKLARECAEVFVKACLDSKPDDAAVLCATPFRGPDGDKQEKIEDVRNILAVKPPDGIKMEVGEPVPLDKFNSLLKKIVAKELNENELKNYAEYLGKDCRMVALHTTIKGNPLPFNRPLLLLIGFRDDKAKIVGMGGP